MRRLILIVLSTLLVQNTTATEFKLAVRAHNGIQHAVHQWQATTDYLSKSIPGHSFKLVPILNLNEITNAAGGAEFDFILTNPSSYVELNKKFSAKALVTLNNKRANTAQDTFGSVVFISAKNDDVVRLSDLKGKTLMAVSESAFGGWRVAWYEFLRQGIDPYKELNVIFSKKSLQNEVVFAVRDGFADAGVVRTDQLERMEAAGNIDMRYFRILNNKEIKSFPFFLSTDLYPEWALAKLKHVPDDVGFKVKNALLAIKDDSQAAREGQYIGWVSAKSYESVEHLLKKLQVGPYEVGSR